MRVAQSFFSAIEDRDHRLMRKCNSWSAPRWVRLWMICATRGGDGWLWYAMALAIALFGGNERWKALTAVTVASTAGTWLFLILKKATGRRRPCVLQPHCWATLLPPDQFSFPSGHSMTAFAVSVPMMSFYPQLEVSLVFCAISVAMSRILLGMHFLSDVVVGSALGALIGFAAVGLVS